MSKKIFGLQKQKRVVRRGQALVEMALVVTILLFLSLGLVQFAIIGNACITLTNISREGARYAAVHCMEPPPPPFTTIEDSIKDYIDVRVAAFTPLRDIAPANITITYPSTGGKASGNQVRVDITYDMRRKFILPTSFPGLSRFGSSITVSTVMIIE